MACTIGIDVGGTNTNAVLIKDGDLIATAKYPTDHHHLLSSTKAVLEEIIALRPSITREDLSLHLSTTLTTNAIVEGRGESVAAIITPGPGSSIADLEFPYPVYPVKGAIDHRGRETAPLDTDHIRKALQDIKNDGIESLALIGKFSVRNPAHELAMERIACHEFPGFHSITLGHRLSGRLNFPRRVTTALLNARVAHIQSDFSKMIRKLSHDFGIGEQIYILKADGGTMQLAESLIRPIETVLSGPAASIMGALTMGSFEAETIVTLDIGGTTTEISVVVGGTPLSEREGAIIAGHRTLVPALFSRSIGLGGDSRISFSNGKLQIGPEREGPPIALGGPALTPTDAVIALGELTMGDRQKAINELKRIGMTVGLNPQELAVQIIDAFCDKAIQGINDTFHYLNDIPVYTVSEVLAPRNLKPEKLIGMGGPAEYFIPKIAAKMALDFQVLPCAEAANAVGAAASRPTVAINLRADTALGKLIVPELDEMSDIPHAMLFDAKQARKVAMEKVIAYAAKTEAYSEPPEIEITDEEVFNVVRGFYTTGKIFTLKAQVRPGVRRVSISNGAKEGKKYEERS